MPEFRASTTGSRGRLSLDIESWLRGIGAAVILLLVRRGFIVKGLTARAANVVRARMRSVDRIGSSRSACSMRTQQWGDRMALYLIQGSYAVPSVAAMIKNPQDRAAVIKAMIEKAGGKLHGFWFALGEYDFVAVAEVSDIAGAAAIAMAVGATGALSAYRTTPLMSTAESVEAMRKAGTMGYQPPR